MIVNNESKQQKVSMRVLLFVLMLYTSGTLSGQSLELGVGAGLSGYSGELASYRLNERFKVLVHPAIQLQLKYALSSKISVSASLWSGSISGADSIATSSTRVRNLDFHSPLTELSVNVEYFPFRKDFEQRYNFYLSGGIGVFRFNPKTYFNNQEVKLQPLGTEGQGLEQYPGRRTYSLTQFSIPISGGIQYRLTESIQIQVSVSGSYTRTDYLDDVSTTYVDGDILAVERGSIAAALANRHIPNANGDIGGAPGSRRGSSGVYDYYFSGFVTLLFDIGGNFGRGCYSW